VGSGYEKSGTIFWVSDVGGIGAKTGRPEERLKKESTTTIPREGQAAHTGEKPRKIFERENC